MYDGQVNKKSGVLIINLPSTACTNFTAAHGDEEKITIYPSTSSWTTLENRSDYEARYPYMPSRIIDNLLKSGAKVSVTNWDNIKDESLF